MKKLILVLFLLFPTYSYAALTGTDRGSGNNNTAGASLTVTPTSNFTTSSFGVLCIALDNSGAAGNNLISPATASGGDGSTWTRGPNSLFDNGAASAGVEVVIYTSNNTSLTTAQSITITWSSTTPTAKSWVLHEVTAGAGKIISTRIGDIGTGATTGSPVFASNPSVNNGEMIIGMGGSESSDTWSPDSDTTNGSWSTHQHNVAGSGTTGMAITSQRKIVSATGTQTYNPTLTSADVILAYIVLQELNAGGLRRVVIIG